MGLLDQTANVIVRDQFSGTFSNLHRQQQQAGAGFDAMGKSSDQAGLSLSNLSGIAGALGVGLSVAGAIGAGKLAIELGNLGAQSIVTRQSFESVTASVGETIALLDRMKAAAGGTIDEMRLMQLANTALAGASGETGAAFADLIPKLIEGARTANKLNPALGDTEFLFQSLVTGIKRGSPLLIDNTGITLSVAEANEKLAQSLGKTTAALTEEEKQLALMQETARGVDRIVAQAGGNLDTMATSADKLKVAFQELKVAIGEGLAPATSTIQEELAGWLSLGTDIIQSDKISRLTAQLDGARVVLETLNNTPVNPGGLLGGGTGFFSDADKQNAIEQQRATIARLEAQILELTNTTDAGTAAIVGFARGASVAGDATIAFGAKAARLSAFLQGVVSSLDQTRDAALRASSAMQASAVRSITGNLLGATDLVSEAQYVGNVGATTTAVNVLTAAYENGAISLDQYNYRIAKLTQANAGWVSGIRTAQREIGGLGDAATSAATDLQSLIDAQLQPSFSLANLAPELAASESNIDEHYRRLAAIALRGGEEIAQHARDWQNTLALIPPDVQAQGIGAIQEWAKAQVQAYDQGLDFSLLDKGLIKDRILKQLQANEMRDAVITEIAGQLGNVSLADLKLAASDAGLGGNVGKQVVGGIKDSINVDAMLLATATAINAGAKTYADQLKASGGAVGGVILDGIKTAVGDGAPDVVMVLAEKIAPSVAAIIKRENRRAGEM